MSSWWIIVPVRGGVLAKSRLTEVFPRGEDRAVLADALAADVVEAARATSAVLGVTVVTAHPEHVRPLAALGAEVIAEPPGAGLDGAVTHAGRLVRAAQPEAGIAVLMGDIPGATAAALTEALRAAERVDRGALADRDGTGTVLLTAGPGLEPRPAYGPGSYARHLAAGHLPLPLDHGSPLRDDLDTLEDLRAATRRGLGPRTAAALRTLQRSND